MFAASVPLQSWNAEDEERALALLCQLLFDEFEATATPDQRRGLQVALGRRLAGLIALPGDADLDSIAARINRLWASLNWGSVGFEADNEGIDIVHRGLPVNGRERLRDWEALLPPILEGAYGAWFEAIGGPSDRLRTRVTGQRSGEVELRHGLGPGLHHAP